MIKCFDTWKECEYHLKICSIASSSEGNCILLGTENVKVLVDIGISRTAAVNGLSRVGVAPEEISAIFITHEHIDHVKGLEVWMKNFDVRCYATKETHKSLRDKFDFSPFSQERFICIEPDQEFVVDDLAVMPFSISHDAANPVGYTFVCNQKKAGIATDLGFYDEYTLKHLKGCEFLLIEANHEPLMVQTGSYPYPLKLRILGDKGHLSNDAAGELAARLLPHGLRKILLGHMSKENNTPDLAYETVRAHLLATNHPELSGMVLSVADRKSPSEVYVI